MDVLLSGLIAILGAVVGFLGSLYIFKRTIKAERKRELNLFYSQIDYIINVALAEKYDEAKGCLANPEIHYAFAKLWLYIPENLRKALYLFLKEGHKIEEKKESGELERLYQMLQKEEK